MPFPLIPILIGAGIGALSSQLGGGDKEKKKKALPIAAALGALTGGAGSMLFGAPAALGAKAASQAGYAATAGGLGSLGTGTAAGSAAASTAGLAGTEEAKQGLLKGFMGSEIGKGLTGQFTSNILGGGGQPAPTMTDVSFPGVPYTEAPIAPTLGGASPLAYATPDWQMQQEIQRRRMMGYGY